jgi:hypothetical protein
METIVKTDVAKMKADIKVIAEEQKFLKNQMKTVHIVGERKMDAGSASYKHLCNRQDLRILYAAYGVARGHSFSQTENHFPQEGHPLHERQGSIDRILKKYEKLVEVETVA